MVEVSLVGKLVEVKAVKEKVKLVGRQTSRETESIYLDGCKKRKERTKTEDKRDRP